MDPDASLAESELYEDYYHNLCAKDFESKLDLNLHFAKYFFHENIFHKDLYFVGIKRELPSQQDSEQMEKLHNVVSRIRREWTLTGSQVAFAYLKHATKVLLISVFGQRCFHDLTYAFRRGSKQLTVRAIGDERYKERGRRRRERGKKRKNVLRSSSNT